MALTLLFLLLGVDEQVDSLKACIGAGATLDEAVEILLTIPSERQTDDPLALGSDKDFSLPGLR